MIEVKSLEKSFRLYREPLDRLKEIFLRRKCHVDHRALDGISFRVASGEALGILGPNGAGKSTILKILTGILLSDRGHVRIDGKITGLLELGTGFNLEMSGLKNVYANALLLGMSKQEIDARFDDIVEFSELDDFIYEPMKTYSSGMVMRLGFSVAIHAEPRCFVIDEALSVGDAYFQQKCTERIRQFRQCGGSIVFVSHDMNAIKMLCDKAILLHKGKVVEEGNPEQVVNSYNFLLSQLGHRSNRVALTSRENSGYGTYDGCIRNVDVVGINSGSDILSSGETGVVSVELESNKDLPEVVVGIMIRDKFGQDVFGTNTYHYDLLRSARAGERMVCRFRMPMNIAPGKYTVTAALHTKSHHLDNCMHWVDNAGAFEIAGYYGHYFSGLCKLAPEIDFEGDVWPCP